MQQKLRAGFGSDNLNIKNLCIGDSQINEYKLENEVLTMVFQDYTNALYEIVLNNCSYISVKGSVGFSLTEGKFKKTDSCDNWHFYDEDGKVFEVRFNGYSMRKI